MVSEESLFDARSSVGGNMAALSERGKYVAGLFGKPRLAFSQDEYLLMNLLGLSHRQDAMMCDE